MTTNILISSSQQGHPPLYFLLQNSAPTPRFTRYAISRTYLEPHKVYHSYIAKA
jgi:hypothetical protein